LKKYNILSTLTKYNKHETLKGFALTTLYTFPVFFLFSQNKGYSNTELYTIYKVL